MTPHALLLVSMLAATPSGVSADDNLAQFTWNADSWRSGVALDAQSARRNNPEVGAPLHSLHGIDPGHYLLRRRPQPEATRELARLRLPTAVLIEKFGDTPHDVGGRTLSDAESLAFRTALVSAIGQSAYPAAPYFLASVATNPNEIEVVRVVATVALGKSSTPAAGESLQALWASFRSPALRNAAVRAAGHLRTAIGLQILLAALADGEVQSAAVRGLGQFASSWAWRNTDGDPALRLSAALALVDGLTTVRDVDVDVVAQAIVTADHPEATGLLRVLATSNDAVISGRAQRALSFVELAELRRR